MTNTTPNSPIPEPTSKVRSKILKTIAKRTFCTIATTSAAGYSHSAGVIYSYADDALWVHTMRTGRKARNIASNGRIGVCIAFRRLPVGPPYTIHFQASAELVAVDDPSVVARAASGALKRITSHGELDVPDSCFVRIQPTGAIHSFGPGARVIDLIRDPLTAGARSFNYSEAA